MTDRIAILTPTMNRSDFVLRALKYYASVGFRGQLIFGDSSNPAQQQLMQRHIAEYSHALRITYHYFENPPYFNDAVCMREMINRTDSDYMVYAGDDDLLVPATLQKCAEFLDGHSDYAAAHGVYVTFMLKTGGAFGKIVETHYQPNHILTSTSSRERWKGYMRHTLSTQYYLHRKQTWQAMYEYLPHVSIRYLGPEVLPCSMSVIAGKIAEVDALSVLFQINPERPFGWNTHSIYSLTSDPAWPAAMRGLKAAVSAELARRDGISPEEAAQYFDVEIWRHLLILSQAHYDMRGYDPVNVFYAAKRRFRNVVGLWSKLRQLRAGQYRNCSLDRITQPSHPYHRDFEAAKAIIEQ